MLIWSVIANSGVKLDSDKSVHRCSCKYNFKINKLKSYAWNSIFIFIFNAQKIQPTCSKRVKCESPLSASGSGNFSDGTPICSCGNCSWRHSSSTISAKWSSSSGCKCSIKLNKSMDFFFSQMLNLTNIKIKHSSCCRVLIKSLNKT